MKKWGLKIPIFLKKFFKKTIDKTIPVCYTLVTRQGKQQQHEREENIMTNKVYYSYEIFYKKNGNDLLEKFYCCSSDEEARKEAERMTAETGIQYYAERVKQKDIDWFADRLYY